jgi:hypothetical protein
MLNVASMADLVCDEIDEIIEVKSIYTQFQLLMKSLAIGLKVCINLAPTLEEQAVLCDWDIADAVCIEEIKMTHPGSTTSDILREYVKCDDKEAQMYST